MPVFWDYATGRRYRVNDQAIRRTLEAAGVEFIDAEGGGPGVRLRQAKNL